MKINEVFSKKLRHSKGGVNVARDTDAVISVNLNEGKTPDPPLISPNLAAPIDAAVAFNVTSDDSTADASTEQNIDVAQNSEAQT